MRTELTAFVQSKLRCVWIMGALAGLAAGSAQVYAADDELPAPAVAPAPSIEAPPSPAAPAATAPAATPPAAVEKPSVATPPAAETTTADGMRKIPSGYRRVKRKGQEVYCRKVTTIGTRFADELCFTREQLEEISNRTDSAMDDLNQAMKVCAGGGACQNN